MPVEEVFEPVLIPARAGLLSLDDEGWVFSDPVPQRFIDSQRRLDIDDPDQETMLIEAPEFLKPIEETGVFLHEIGRILLHILLTVLFGKVNLIEEDLAVAAMAKGGEHPGDDF